MIPSARDAPAPDAADRLILDESAAARADSADGDVVVIGDASGALALAARSSTGGTIRVHQDALSSERALADEALRRGTPGAVRSLPLAPDLVRGARVVLLRLPRSLRALDDIAGLVAAHAASDVAVFAGGRVKHMSLGMNDVLRARFSRLDVTRARQKSRVLVARGPLHGRDPSPEVTTHDGLAIAAYGGVFAGAGIDIGTRFLLAHLPEAIDAAEAVDLACGSGVIGAFLARRQPGLRIRATDDSAAAVASARATARANGIADRMSVVQDDSLASVTDATASFVTVNPPFHDGAAIDETLALRLFADAARALRPGGELWAVWNSPLSYRPALERLVGPTRQIARNPKFTVTASTRR